MSNPTTTTLLNANDKIVGMSNDGRYVSFIETSGNNQSLFVLDVTSNQRTLIDTFNGIATAADGATTGIDGGALSPNGEFIFYSKGFTKGDDGTSNGQTLLFEKDLQSDTPPIDVTPHVPQPGFPGIAIGLLPEAISDDGLTVVYSESYTDFTDTNPDFDGVVVENLVSGSQQQFAGHFAGPDITTEIKTANLSEDGRYLSYVDGDFFEVQDLQSHTELSKVFDGGGSVSNDGRYVVYAERLDSNGHAANDGDLQLLVHDNASPTAGDQIIPTSMFWSSSEPGAAFAAVSGDGRHVVFAVEDAAGTGNNYYVEDIDSGVVQLLKQNADFNETVFISNDGSRIFIGGGDGVTVTTFQPPTLTISPITGDDVVNSTDGIIIVAGTSSAIGQTVTVTVEGESGASHTAHALVQSNGTWAALMNIGPPQPDGDHFIDATVTDELTTTATRKFNVDATAPSLALSSIAGDGIVNAAEISSIDIEGTASDNSTGFTGELVHLSIDHTAIGTAQVLASGDWSFHYDGHSLADGQHEIEFSVSDTAGNGKSETASFVVDTTPPKVAITSIGNNNVVDVNQYRHGAEVTGTSDEIGGTVHVNDPFGNEATATVGADGTWQTTAYFSGDPSGPNQLTATITDAAGNVGTGTGQALVDSGIVDISAHTPGVENEVYGYNDPSISGDGTIIAYDDGQDIFVRNIQTGVYTTITKGLGGSASDGESYAPAVSQNGQVVTYYSDASNLVAGDTNGGLDVFVTNIATGVTQRIDTTTGGSEVAAMSESMRFGGAPAISADGTLIAFTSDSSGLIPGVSGTQVYLKNTLTGDIQLVSADASGHPLAGINNQPSMSADGRYITFTSTASGGFTDPTRPNDSAEDGVDPASDIFVRDMDPHTSTPLTLVSATPAGAPADNASSGSTISPDGNFIVFTTFSGDLIPGDPALVSDSVNAIVFNRTNGQMTSLTDFIAESGFGNGEYSFASDGTTDDRHVTFSTETNVDPADPGNESDSYIYDLNTNTFSFVLGFHAHLSSDGHYVAFFSELPLTADSADGRNDIYLQELVPHSMTFAPVNGNNSVNSPNAGAVALTGTSDLIGGTVKIAVDGTQVTTTQVGTDSAWHDSIDLSAFAIGSHTITATVADAVGFTASAGEIVKIVSLPPVVVSVQTAAGIDLRWGTLYDELANSPIATGGSVTQYTVIDSGAFNGHTAAVKFVVSGTSFSYSGSSPNIQLTGGTITGIEEQDSSGNVLATFTGLSISATVLQTALNTYIAGGASPVSSTLNAIFLSVPYEVTGGAGLDRLQGGNLADTFLASVGNDTINGLAGANIVDYSDLGTSGLVAVVQGGTGTVSKGGANGTDTLNGIGVIVDTGSNRSDIFEVDAAEKITANGANFNYLIELSTGVNLVYGTQFTGITEFVSDTGNNTVDFSADTQFAYVYGSTGSDTLTLGTGGGYLIGEGGTNTLNGGANATNLFIGGQGGTDTMNGGGGSASNYYFVDGNDQVNGAGAFNVVVELVAGITVQLGSAQYQDVQEIVSNGGANAVGVAAGNSNFNYLYGGTGNDTLTTGSGGGYLIGEGGTNVLTGGGGTNVFVADGGTGVDTMNGGSGSNIYFIDANSTVHGAGTFNTAIELQQGVALALGSAQLGSDIQEVVLSGGTNTVDFHTATSQVFLYGSVGDDSLFGGGGSDFLYGAGGTNTFQFAAGWGKDTIEDWTAGTNDIIDLTGLSSLGVHAITDLTQTISGGKDVITSSLTGTNSITLVGVGSALAASSFHFT